MCLLAACAKRTEGWDDGVGPDFDPDEILISERVGPGTRLPPDDGLPLTEAEKTAFLSTGDFDKKLTKRQLVDVLRHFKHWVHKERGTVEACVSRGALYMPMIRQVLAERGLPADLAYIPFVESNYSVFVYHARTSRAMGMWQFVPVTADELGLRRDLWVDERRDPRSSTVQAARYFMQLRNMFKGDWHLAIAAYNAGPGKIRRGLEAAGAKSFFDLRDRDARIHNPKLKMSQENKQYLPKLLAAAKIMRNLELLGFKSLPAAPAMERVIVKPGLELPCLAVKSGMTWTSFLRHNGGYLRRFSPPARTTAAMVPAGRRRQVEDWIRSEIGTQRYATWQGYVVRAGDTLPNIASRFGTTVSELRQVNQLDGKDFGNGISLLVPKIVPQRVRAVPGKGGRVILRTTKAQPVYIVRPGDTLWGISRKTDTPIPVLQKLNGIKPNGAGLRAGMRLRLR